MLTASTAYVIRPLALTDTDEASIERLWQEALGSRWPIAASLLVQCLGRSGDPHRFIQRGAFVDSRLVGIGVAEITDQTEATLILLAVVPDCQRHGIATRLLYDLRLIFEAKGIRTVTLGAGASQPLWHGIPLSLPGAVAFFQHHGCELDEASDDLVRDLSDFRAPTPVLKRARQYGVRFKALSTREVSSLLAFEKTHFPYWYSFFAAAIADGALRDILIARRQQEIIGSTLLSEAPDCPGAQWAQRLGPRLGALGVIGVAPAHRGHGVGLAFAAYATQRLRNRGVRTCFLHWTHLRDWYGQLGFQVWEEYRLGRLPSAMEQPSVPVSVSRLPGL